MTYLSKKVLAAMGNVELYGRLGQLSVQLSKGGLSCPERVMWEKLLTEYQRRFPEKVEDMNRFLKLLERAAR